MHGKGLEAGTKTCLRSPGANDSRRLLLRAYVGSLAGDYEQERGRVAIKRGVLAACGY